jgi:hypothetical protein
VCGGSVSHCVCAVETHDGARNVAMANPPARRYYTDAAVLDPTDAGVVAALAPARRHAAETRKAEANTLFAERDFPGAVRKQVM